MFSRKHDVTSCVVDFKPANVMLDSLARRSGLGHFVHIYTSLKYMKFSPRRGRQRAFKRPIAIVQKKVAQEYCQWTIDYKNIALLQKLITHEGKIIPRRITGMNAKQHRAIANAIKNARMVGLLPFIHVLQTRV